jgi:hypothetical protein
VVPQLQEHLRYVGKAKLAGIVLSQRVELARGDLVLPDLVRFFEERAHVFDEAARSRGW